MAGIRDDQSALYIKDMYKAERDGKKQVTPVYDQLFMVNNNVSGAGDKVTQILGAGRLTRHETETTDINYKSPIQGWQYFVNYWMYSDGIALSKPATEDTVKLGNLLTDLAKTWGKQVIIAKEEMAARVFNKGGTTTGDWVFNGTHTGNTAPYGNKLYDNYCLFNLTGNKRSTKGGGTYYNSVASLALNPANFETLYNLHTATNNRDERDEVCANPADTLLVSPGADRFTAEKIVDTSRGLPGGQLNDKNPYYKIVNVIAWDYLNTTSSPWYLGRAKDETWQFHERQQSEIRYHVDENNLCRKASINIRIGILIKDFRTWSRGGGSS
jgi:hypothetical protein